MSMEELYPPPQGVNWMPVLAILAIVLGLIAASWVGVRIGGVDAQRLRQEAISRGYAQHNPTTGEWEWVDKEEVTK